MLDDKAERGVPARTEVAAPQGAAGDDALAGRSLGGDHTRVVATLASAAAEIRGLSVGACALVRIPSTFPQQFICIGTSDQIERLLLQPD